MIPQSPCCICGGPDGSVEAQWDGRSVRVCPACFAYETGNTECVVCDGGRIVTDEETGAPEPCLACEPEPERRQ